MYNGDHLTKKIELDTSRSESRFILHIKPTAVVFPRPEFLPGGRGSVRSTRGRIDGPRHHYDGQPNELRRRLRRRSDLLVVRRRLLFLLPSSIAPWPPARFREGGAPSL